MACRVLKTKNWRETQGYSSEHKAVDGTASNKTLDYIVAHTDGQVVFCQTGQRYNPGSEGNASYGICVKIKHKGNYYTLYAHMSSVSVKYGQTVKRTSNWLYGKHRKY